MDEAAKSFPEGLEYTIVYNPTEFIRQSIDAVIHTIGEALAAGGAGCDPVPADVARRDYPRSLAIPVSLVGTFFVMALFGFSLNNLSLFGLVLAIGIVVDDAIVVAENVERNIAAGLSPARCRAQGV